LGFNPKNWFRSYTTANCYYVLPTHFLFHFANFACPEAILATEAAEAEATEAAEAEATEAVAEAAQASDDDDEKDTNLHWRLLSVERKP
jgi:hypothetical protein